MSIAVTTNPKKMYYNAGETIGSMPQDPFVAGKVFEKWVIEGTETELTADTIVNDDMKVVAVFHEVAVYNNKGREIDFRAVKDNKVFLVQVAYSVTEDKVYERENKNKVTKQ